MRIMKNFILVFVLIMAPAVSKAELMTVYMLKEMLQKGALGELAATTYVQGVVDGMLGMDSMLHKEGKTQYEFCKFHEATSAGVAFSHPAYQTKALVSAWERKGHPMNAPVIDMVVSYMTAQFGCK